MNTDYEKVLQKFGNIEELQHELEDKFSTPNDIFEDKALPDELANNFCSSYNESYKKVFETNYLSARIKSLISLAVASAVHCPYCINMYTHDALKMAGAKSKS